MKRASGLLVIPTRKNSIFCGRKPEGDFSLLQAPYFVLAFNLKNQKDDDLGDEIPEFIEKKVKASG